MMRETAACLWPRAIIDVIPSSGALAATANILRNFDPGLSQAQSRLRLDVTHLQPVMGSPLHIAQHIKRRLSRGQHSKTVTMGVASDPNVAAYAAGVASSGSIKTIAPWEVQSSLRHESIEVICQLTPDLAHKFRRVGICTGAQIADQPLAVIKRVFGSAGVVLWRTCRGETNAAALEIDEQYRSIRCRAVLPPRTIILRSIQSHLRRVTNSLLSILRNRQRVPTVIFFSMQETTQAVIEIAELDIDCNALSPRDLASVAKDTMSRHWGGQALRFVELGARQLYDSSGQLDLFSSE